MGSGCKPDPVKKYGQMVSSKAGQQMMKLLMRMIPGFAIKRQMRELYAVEGL